MTIKKIITLNIILLLLSTSIIGCSNFNSITKEKGVWSGNGKEYPIEKVNGTRVLRIPPEEYLLQKEVPTPVAPTSEGTAIQVSLQSQRAWLYKEGVLDLTSVICPGKPGYETPTGNYHVISKHKEWESTIYHVPMPFFLRLNTANDSVGLHAGIIAVGPASHGCIRLPKHSAEEFFNATPVGTKVFINNN